MSLDASAAVVNVEVYTTERSHKMKISQNKYLSLIAVFGLIACGNPTMEMPDRESSDASVDSRQFPDSQMVSEDADSSVIEEDSSVMESDASVSDSSDSGSDSSRADAAARETNVLYRTSDGGYEGVIEFNSVEISTDAGINPTMRIIGNRIRNYATAGDNFGRIFPSGCSYVLLNRFSVIHQNIEGIADSGPQDLVFSFSVSCGSAPTRIIMQTCSGVTSVLTENSFDTCTILSISKTVRVE